jgi:hypothetical protein
VFLMSARDQAVLAAIAGRTAKIGFMLFEMRRAADRIGKALESGLPEIVAPEAIPVADPVPVVAALEADASVEAGVADTPTGGDLHLIPQPSAAAE